MYSVESVIMALKSNAALIVENDDTMGCPMSGSDCPENPDNCEIGNSQSCKQPITIYANYQKLVILVFRYKISKNNRDGFIRKDDSALERLIRYKYINEHLLRPALKNG
jgi:hypothetical protein